MRRSALGLLSAGTSLAVLGAACSSNDQGPGQSPLVIEKPTKSGDQQVGPAGMALGNALRVLITRDGAPVEGVDVAWSVGQGGSLAQEEPSDQQGIASVTWTLGPAEGSQSATAAVDGAEGSPLSFTAIATPGTEPPPEPTTIQVLGPSGGNRFEPSVVTITVGQTVTWTWPQGALSHNVVPDDGNTPALSGPVTNGPEVYQFTFTQPGEYRFYCMSHGGAGGVGMSGRVIVGDVQP